jgi:hypothetical protein
MTSDFTRMCRGFAVNLKSIVVNLGNSSAIAQAEPTRSDFDPFEGRLFCPFLTFKNSVFLSVIVNEFNFANLMSNHLTPPSIIARGWWRLDAQEKVMQ